MTLVILAQILMLIGQINEDTNTHQILEASTSRLARRLTILTGITDYNVYNRNDVILLVREVRDKIMDYHLRYNMDDPTKRVKAINHMCELLDKHLTAEATYNEMKLLAVCLADLLSEATYPADISAIRDLISVAHKEINHNVNCGNTTDNTIKEKTITVKELILKHISRLEQYVEAHQDFLIRVEISIIYRLADNFKIKYTQGVEPLYAQAGAIIAEMELYIHGV